MPVKPWSRRVSPRERTANRLPDFPVGVYPARGSVNTEHLVEDPQAFSRTTAFADLKKVSLSLAERVSDQDTEEIQDARAALDEAREKGTVRWKSIKDDVGL